MFLLLPFWVMLCLGVAQVVLVGAIWVLGHAGLSLAGLNPTTANTVVAVLVYMVTLVFVIGVPLWVRKNRTTRSTLGLNRLPSWMDIILAPAGFIVYGLASAIVSYAAMKLIPGFDATQAQNIGFSNLSHSYEYVLAFATLVVLAPLAEEVLFRGYLYGKLKNHLPIWAAVLVTSAAFGLAHGQWNVGIDVFVLSIVLCCLREVTGNIWAGVLLHMLKNGVAFYFLFINTSLLMH